MNKRLFFKNESGDVANFSLVFYDQFWRKKTSIFEL